MIDSTKFDLLKWREPNFENKGRDITGIIGLDTEARPDGSPFLLALSDGTFSRSSAHMIEILLDGYCDNHIVVFNLKYDSGALLYDLPFKVKYELWENGVVKCGKIQIKYIPHKYLEFRLSSKKILHIWDIAQYYHSSLDKAGKKWLGRGKMEMETKDFTDEFIEHNFNRIKKYCIEDAKLTADLAVFFLDKLAEFGIRATALYSAASLSLRYFADRTKIVTAWRYFNHYPELLKVSMDSYEGGKFEVTGRGAFNGFEYDLVSAYPFEIRNLVDISLAKVLKTKKYQEDAIYGFLRVRIRNNTFEHLPCGRMIDKVRVYPMGDFYLTITKGEYDYIVNNTKIEVDILEGYWLFVNKKKYPYRGVIDLLFELKAKYKGLDDMLYMTTKLMQNSFYGKCVQCIENPQGFFDAGQGFNPLYGSIITANTRIRVTDIQNRFKDDCLAVHTDSVILTRPLEQTGQKLGDFDLQYQGRGIVVACGQYEIGEKQAFKGFAPLPRKKKNGEVTKESWTAILKANRKKKFIAYPVLHVTSWCEAMAKGHPDTINRFERTEKVIDLNGDCKRVWTRAATGGDLLTSRETSLPRIVHDNQPPKHWSI